VSKFTELVNGASPVLVEVFADWCTPCEALTPILKEVKSSFNKKIKIIKIDIDKNQQIADKFQIKGVPTLLLFKNGEVIWKFSGLIDKKELINILKEKI
tara:strand:- start:244 stop:540 length:297 start_codon:yes stop_codon:yes gene_type:complete